MAAATTSYVVSLDYVMTEHGDNVEDKQVNLEEEVDQEAEYHSLNKIIQTLPKEDVKFIDLFYRSGFSQKIFPVSLNVLRQQ